MILRVSGPNEHDNNVNNYRDTNLVAKRTLLEYTIECLKYVRNYHPPRYQVIIYKTAFDFGP